MDCIYIALLSKALFIIDASHSPIHTHTHPPTVKGCHARYQSARWEQLGVRCLAQDVMKTSLKS
uniref:Uncharacterized protein n=1 Tax=Anguilla anguilla TaxID=7936 RepID=A0A0E9WNY1_ANGAN